MKWLAKYKDNDVRVIKKFLLIPWKLDNEWRWLEYAYIKESYYMSMWSEKRWATHEEYMAYTVKQAMKYFNISPEIVADFKHAYLSTNESTFTEKDFKSELTKVEQKELHDYMEDNPR